MPGLGGFLFDLTFGFCRLIGVGRDVAPLRGACRRYGGCRSIRRSFFRCDLSSMSFQRAVNTRPKGKQLLARPRGAPRHLRALFQRALRARCSPRGADHRRMRLIPQCNSALPLVHQLRTRARVAQCQAGSTPSRVGKMRVEAPSGEGRGFGALAAHDETLDFI